MSGYKPVRDVWNFEKYLASSPVVWKNEAYNLKGAILVLFQYDEKEFRLLFSEKTIPPLPASFRAKVERMLMGFSIENLIKAILLQNPTECASRFSKDGNLSWGKDGHNLIKLLTSANIPLNDQESTYMELWQTCATWAGRYPLPLNENELPRQRKSAQSSEELLKREEKQIKKALCEGDSFLGAEIFDLLHTGVGNNEKNTYITLFDRLINMLQARERPIPNLENDQSRMNG